MDEFAEQAKELLSQRVNQVREEHTRLTRAEKKAQGETLDRILFSLTDADREWLDAHMAGEVILTNDECEALYLAGLRDGLLKLVML